MLRGNCLRWDSSSTRGNRRPSQKSAGKRWEFLQVICPSMSLSHVGNSTYFPWVGGGGGRGGLSSFEDKAWKYLAFRGYMICYHKATEIHGTLSRRSTIQYFSDSYILTAPVATRKLSTVLLPLYGTSQTRYKWCAHKIRDHQIRMTFIIFSGTAAWCSKAFQILEY